VSSSQEEILSIPVDYQGPAVMGLGAFLKNTISVVKDGEALVSPNLGDLDSPEALKAFEETVDRMIEAAGEKPIQLAHDLHPNFFSTHYAARSEIEAVAVQHHHAHVGAAMLECGVTEPVIGLSLDGFGLGPGDQSWGGELLTVDCNGYERIGYLKTIKQPGGDIAARQPWRMGAAVLHELGRDGEISSLYKDMEGQGIVAQMLAKDLNSPKTSSCGRLFDAACGLLGVKLIAEFEGEAPMALEALATNPQIDHEGWRLEEGVLNLMPLMGKLPGMDATEGANLFHGTISAALEAWALDAVEKTDCNTVALTGGCFFNAVVRGIVTEGLQQKGIKLLFPERTSPGDPSISLGQAWVLAMQQSGEK